MVDDPIMDRVKKIDHMLELRGIYDKQKRMSMVMDAVLDYLNEKEQSGRSHRHAN